MSSIDIHVEHYPDGCPRSTFNSSDWTINDQIIKLAGYDLLAGYRWHSEYALRSFFESCVSMAPEPPEKALEANIA